MRLFIFMSIALLFAGISNAQWQSDVRLTNDPSGSATSLNNAWCVAANGSVVHVAWYDFRDGNLEIYYKRSTDGGVSWGADTRLTNDTASSGIPSISVSGQVVHVAWQDMRDGNYEIYYKRSTDGGVSWEADTRLTNNSASSGTCSISVSGQKVHVVWQDNRDGNYEIYHKRSTDGGVNWGADNRLTNDPASSTYSSVSVSDQAVHAAWFDFRDGNNEIYFKGSTDGGVSWSADIRLTNDPASSVAPSIAVSGQVVHLVWRDLRDGNEEIYYKRSMDGGTSWAADTRLTINSAISRFSSVSVSGQAVHVVWPDYRDGNWEIYYKRSGDGGTNWGTDTRLTNDPAQSFYSSVSVSDQIVHVVWQDIRDGNNELYYKRDPAGNPVEIVNILSVIPEKFSLSQNYPNPFNPITKIKFALPLSSFTKLEVFDVLGRVVTILVNEQLQPGTYESDFDGTKLSSGVYFYTLKTSKFTDTKKMILVK